MADPAGRIWVWVCGPYAGTRTINLAALHAAAKAVFDRGHVPIIGIVNALPLIELGGFDPESAEIRKPLSEALMQRCDACLRIGGSSPGADREVAWFRAQGRVVFADVADIPEGSPWS